MKSKEIKVTTVILSIILFVASLADLKFKGKLYQNLPTSVQSKVDTYMN